MIKQVPELFCRLITEILPFVCNYLQCCREFEDVVVQANRAVSGYKEPFKRGVLSLSEAMTRRLVTEKHAIR